MKHLTLDSLDYLSLVYYDEKHIFENLTTTIQEDDHVHHVKLGTKDHHETSGRRLYQTTFYI